MTERGLSTGSSELAQLPVVPGTTLDVVAEDVGATTMTSPVPVVTDNSATSRQRLKVREAPLAQSRDI